MKEIFEYIDKNKEKILKDAKEFIAIKSVSADMSLRGESRRCAEYVKNVLEKLGAKAEIFELNTNSICVHPKTLVFECPKDENPVVYGSIKGKNAKRTICLYGHYDVQPAKKEDGWNSDPFELTEKDGVLYGRGIVDDKGQLLAWFKALEAFKETKKDLPVNFKFLIEGMEESGGEGLEKFIKERKDLLGDVDCFVISDSNWFDKERPAITYGLRGIVAPIITIEGPKQDLHSGEYGGAVYEPVNEIMYIASKLLDPSTGKCLVPGFYDDVEKVTNDEKKIYEEIKIDIENYKKDLGVKKLLKETSSELLMSTWRFPTITIHGIEGAYYEAGRKTVIPHRASLKLSMRLVPNQDPEKIEKSFREFVEKNFKEIKSPNRLSFDIHSVKAWKTKPDNEYVKAAMAAFEKIYKKKAVLARCGGSIPIVLTLDETYKKPVVLIPVSPEGKAHSANEFMEKRFLFESAKVMAQFIEDVAK